MASSESETERQQPPRPRSRRERRRSKGNGRGAGGSPGLRDLLFEDLRPADLPRRFRNDLKQLYHFYLDEERRAQLASMKNIKRPWKAVGWTLKSLLVKLSPGRRLALFVSLVMCLVGPAARAMGEVALTTDLRLWGYFILLLVLMLELKDKLLARSEIDVARQVQLALLPDRHPQPEGWSLWSFMWPANDVGADLVDYLELPGQRLGVVLADVAGKGLGAALLTSKLQATLRALVPECPSLSELGERMNAILHRDGIDNRFATLFYFEIAPANDHMRYLNAGHNPPFVLRRSESESLEASALPLGMMAGTTYREGETRIEPGDILVIYSDGLTEARSAQDEEFGADRLRALLPRLRGLSAEQAVRAIADEVNGFLGGERPHDDLSLVVLTRTGEAAGAAPPPQAAPASE